MQFERPAQLLEQWLQDTEILADKRGGIIALGNLQALESFFWKLNERRFSNNSSFHVTKWSICVKEDLHRFIWLRTLSEMT